MTDDFEPLFDIDAANDLSARLHAIKKDTSAKTWWDADPVHPAICRALRIDPDQHGAFYAKLPFRLARVDDKAVILVAHPTPRVLGPVDMDHLGIEQVLAWDPTTDAIHMLGDKHPQLFGGFTDTERGSIFGTPRDFFTAWLRERAAFYVRWKEMQSGEWRHPATETDLVPGALLTGAPDKIRWRPTTMPAELACVGIDAKAVNRALLKAAHIPLAHNNSLRVAA